MRRIENEPLLWFLVLPAAFIGATTASVLSLPLRCLGEWGTCTALSLSTFAFVAIGMYPAPRFKIIVGGILAAFASFLNSALTFFGGVHGTSFEAFFLSQSIGTLVALWIGTRGKKGFG
jgi:hypothetical protein